MGHELTHPVGTLCEVIMENHGGTEVCIDGKPEARSREPSAAKRGRPRPRWRIRVVPVDAHKHVELMRGREHPFAAMAAEARVAEIDAFCARLWARTKRRA